MDKYILNIKIQDFIKEKSNSKTDLKKLILSKNPFPEIPIQLLAQQISGRQKSLQKFPLWARTKDIYYPPNSNLEQTSSEITAKYKSSLLAGKTLLDVTGGFGIDDYYFSLTIQQVIHCELNTELSTIAAHNFEVLGAQNIECLTGDGLLLLEKQPHLDWIYIDPSRRHDAKGKVFFLEDCLPNVPEALEFLYQKSANILLKTAPLLDIKSGINSLDGVKEIHVVAVKNEVKELLWVLEHQYNGDPIIRTINLTTKGTDYFSFSPTEETKTTTSFSEPMEYLYEPNAALMKSGGFNVLAEKFELQKLHPNTHLYTAAHEINFPGRVFKVIEIIPYNKKSLKTLQLEKANITTRNFPESVAVLRKKLKIKDGGEDYLFFTTIPNGNRVVLCCLKA